MARAQRQTSQTPGPDELALARGVPGGHRQDRSDPRADLTALRRPTVHTDPIDPTTRTQPGPVGMPTPGPETTVRPRPGPRPSWIAVPHRHKRRPPIAPVHSGLVGVFDEADHLGALAVACLPGPLALGVLAVGGEPLSLPLPCGGQQGVIGYVLADDRCGDHVVVEV